MNDLSKILPETLSELGKMDYLNLLIVVVGMVAFAVVWKLPDIIRARKGK